MNKNNAHYKKAMESIKNNKVSDAVEEIKLCLKFNSRNVSALNLLGLAYYLKCRFDKAEKMWKKSLRLKKDSNKARDYLELITKKDFKELRKEYKKILFNDSENQNKKIKFLKELIAEYDELIEPYVILGLFYKKEENYQEALKYFYQAYDLDSSNQNIKDYILQCEKEDVKSSSFNFKSKSSRTSAAVAGLITFALIALFLNLSGLSPLGWLEANISGFNLSQTEKSEQNQSSEQITNENSAPKNEQINKSSNLEAASKSQKEPSQNSESGQTSTKNGLNSEVEKFNSSQKDILTKINLMEFVNDEAFLSLENIKEINKREREKENLKEAENFLEEGTEQQLFNLAVDYFSRGDYQNGADIFKSIYTLSETEYLKRESLFLLARSYDKLNQYDSAEHYYRIYLNEYSETNYYDEALYNLGLMLNKAGKKEKSRQILKRLREEAPYSKYNNSQVYQILN